MVEHLLFLVLAFSSRVAGEGISFEESLHALDKAAKAVQVEDDNQQTERLEELLEGVPFKPHVYTVRITEPPVQTPVQGFKNSWRIQKDPFYTPIPIADKPEVMKEIQVVHMETQPPPANSLLIACATIFIIILLFGSAIIMAHCFYVLSLSNSRSDLDFSSSTLLEGVGYVDYASSDQAKQKAAFDSTGGESMDEMPTLTDESARTIETTRSESEPPPGGLDSRARPPAGQDSSARPPAGQDSPSWLPPGQDSPARRPSGQDSPARPPPGQDSPARPPPGQDSPARPPAGQDSPSWLPPGQDSPARRPSGQDSPARPPPGQDSPARPPPGQDSPARPPAGQDSLTRPPSGLDSSARPPPGLDSPARPPPGLDSPTRPPAGPPPPPPPAPPLPKP